MKELNTRSRYFGSISKKFVDYIKAIKSPQSLLNTKN